MNKQIIIAICLLTLIGCAKTPDPVPPSQALAGLNSNESSMLGTWYLQSQVINSIADTITYSGYGSQFNISFRYGQLAPNTTTYTHGSTNCKNYIGTWLPNTPIDRNNSDPIILGGVNKIFVKRINQADSIIYDSVHRSDFWYRDNASTLLIIGDSKSIVTLNSGVLTVTWTNGSETIVSTLQQ